MFKKLKDKLSGVMGYDRLMSISIGFISELMEDQESLQQFDIKAFKNNSALFEEWKVYHSDEIIKVANAKNKFDQILQLRRVTVSAIESSVMSIKFFDRAEADQRILADKLNKGEDLEKAIAMEAQLYAFNNASCRCFRVISSMHGDVKENDWFVMYSDVFSQHVLHLYESIIAKAKDDVYALEPLIIVSKSMIDEVKPKIFEGANWDYDKEAMEKERELEEAEEKAKEPPKQKVITSHQIDELSEYLNERYGRLCNGELYKIKGYSPTNPMGVLSIDSGIMLIALSECLEGRDAAINALKKIMYKFVNKIGPKSKELQGKTEEDINIEEQKEILNIIEDDTDAGWLTQVAVLATHYLYSIDSENLSKEEHRALGELSAQNINDAWEVYTNTKNVFGWEFDTDPLFSE